MIVRDLLGLLMESSEPEWKKKPVVYQSTHTGRGGKKFTQSAVNWRKVSTGPSIPGRIERIYDAWNKLKDDITKFVSWDNTAMETGLSVEDIASEVKAVFARDPSMVGFSVNRMGDGTYFKFKGKLVHD